MQFLSDNGIAHLNKPTNMEDLIKQGIISFTLVLLETGRRRAPAPATLAFALAIEGRREPRAVAER